MYTRFSLVKIFAGTARQKSLPPGVPADSLGPAGKCSMGPKRDPAGSLRRAMALGERRLGQLGSPQAQGW